MTSCISRPRLDKRMNRVLYEFAVMEEVQCEVKFLCSSPNARCETEISNLLNYSYACSERALSPVSAEIRPWKQMYTHIKL